MGRLGRQRERLWRLTSVGDTLYPRHSDDRYYRRYDDRPPERFCVRQGMRRRDGAGSACDAYIALLRVRIGLQVASGSECTRAATVQGYLMPTAVWHARSEPLEGMTGTVRAGYRSRR
jgi:hypothetical protein